MTIFVYLWCGIIFVKPEYMYIAAMVVLFTELFHILYFTTQGLV